MKEMEKNSSTSEKLILIVEDDMMLSAGLIRALQEEGRKIERCGNIRDARHLITQKQPDLMILDINRVIFSVVLSTFCGPFVSIFFLNVDYHGYSFNTVSYSDVYKPVLRSNVSFRSSKYKPLNTLTLLMPPLNLPV